MPSAAQMKEEGVNVIEMQMLLLKKVEELTLQMIKMKAEKDSEIEFLQIINHMRIKLLLFTAAFLTALIDVTVAQHITIQSTAPTYSGDIYHLSGRIGVGTTNPIFGKLQVTQSNDASDGGIAVLNATGQRAMRLQATLTFFQVQMELVI